MFGTAHIFMSMTPPAVQQLEDQVHEMQTLSLQTAVEPSIVQEKAQEMTADEAHIRTGLNPERYSDILKVSSAHHFCI